MKLIVTCEHGGNTIPLEYTSYFKNEKVLQTHRGYDLGALDLFHHLEPLSDASFYSSTSRLLVELNRSLFHKQLFSEYIKNLKNDEKDLILEHYYKPYRLAVENKIATYIKNNHNVLHLSIHSFTPELNGEKRRCDIGLLYDSTKKPEQHYCKIFKTEILKLNPKLNIRFNYPYLGKADGFTTFLRKQFSNHYLGIEIEINQKFATNNMIPQELKETLFKIIELLKADIKLYENNDLNVLQSSKPN